jgi:hypothetical protein
MPFPLYLLCHCCEPAAAMLVRLLRDLTSRRQQPYSLFVWLVVGWCGFVWREKYCYLVVGGWFVLREKYY